MRAAVHRGRGVAGPDRAPIGADQPAGAPPAAPIDADRPARHIAGVHLGPVFNHPRQNPGVVSAGADVGRQHPHVADLAAVADLPEQPAPPGIGNRQVADGMPVALESRGEPQPDRRPERVGVGGGHHPVAIGVKVQIRHQFVAGAGARGAAHPAAGGGIPAPERPRITVGVRPRRGGPVAVQIPADGVQLVQVADFNQPVVVGVVINPAGRVEDRVIAGGAEIPGVVRGIIAVQIDVPVGVNAGIADGRPQIAGSLGGDGVAAAGEVASSADAGGGSGVNLAVAIVVVNLGVDVAIRGDDIGEPPDKPADIGIVAGAGDGAGGVAGGDCAGGVSADQSADLDIIPAGAGGDRGIGGPDDAPVDAGQPAQAGIASGGGDRSAGGVAGAHRAAGGDFAGQHADAAEPPPAAHAGVDEPQIPDHGAALQTAEQPGELAAVGDGQAGDGMAVAIENRPVTVDGRPVGVGVGGCNHPVAVGVEVQIRIQLVAGAAARRAAHPGAGNREGKRGSVGGGVGRRRIPVAVQVPADGVQLVQIDHFDQPVIVAVIVDHPLAGPVQPRVLAG